MLRDSALMQPFLSSSGRPSFFIASTFTSRSFSSMSPDQRPSLRCSGLRPTTKSPTASFSTPNNSDLTDIFPELLYATCVARLRGPRHRRGCAAAVFIARRVFGRASSDAGSRLLRGFRGRRGDVVKGA